LKSYGDAFDSDTLQVLNELTTWDVVRYVVFTTPFYIAFTALFSACILKRSQENRPGVSFLVFLSLLILLVHEFTRVSDQRKEFLDKSLFHIRKNFDLMPPLYAHSSSIQILYLFLRQPFAAILGVLFLVLSKMLLRREMLLEGYRGKLRSKAHSLFKFRLNSKINLDELDENMNLKDRPLDPESFVLRRFTYLYASEQRLNKNKDYRSCDKKLAGKLKKHPKLLPKLFYDAILLPEKQQVKKVVTKNETSGMSLEQKQQLLQKKQREAQL